MNLKNKLNRFNSQLVNTKKTVKHKPTISSRYKKLADAMGGEVITNFAGSYCMVKRVYPYGHQHGNKTLHKIIKEIPVTAFTSKQNDNVVSIENLLFFDIETTGLGGSGAVPFLVGFASLTNEGFEVRQYLLADYPDETAMLEDILAELAPGKSLVSYNGTTFDLPFMKDRMILNRVAKEFNTEIHIDLLHATRRFYKRRLKNCKLTNIEEKIFQFFRDDDIPGYLVPSVFFEWLNSDSLEMMDDVLEHNRLDILSLYFLLLEIADIYQTKGETVSEIDDLHSLSKIFHKKKDYATSQEVCEYIQNISNGIISSDILYFQSMQFKKTNQHDKAIELWKLLSDIDCSEKFSVYIELAKYYEHKEKDYPTALKFSQNAQKLNLNSERFQTALENRISRLERKIK